MMKKKRNRLMVLLLAIAMTVSLFSSSAYVAEAEEAQETETVATDTIETESAWPAQTFSGSTKDLLIEASVEEDVFPEGTTMQVKTVTRSQLDQILAEEEATDAIAADITFYDREGNEIQPAEGKSVAVTLIARRIVEGETHEAVTMDAQGNTETVGDATAVQSTFDAEHFTIYAIIGKDEAPALLTVNFYDQEGTLLSTQIVKNGDVLLEPEVPETIDKKSFIGWFAEGSDSAFNGFGEVDNVTETKTLDLTATYSSESVHVIYHDQLDNVVDSIEVAVNGTVEVFPDSPVVKTTGDTQCHIGWATEKDGTVNVAGTLNVGNKDINLYPIVKEGYWVTFDTDGGTAYNRQFIALDATGDDKKAKNPGDPYKEGYSFDGWYADKEHTEEFGFTQDITSDVTVYAKWIEDPNTYYIVEYYVEYQSDIASDTWDYKLVATEVTTAQKGSDAEYDNNKIFNEPYSYNKLGYSLNTEKTEQDVKVADDGSTVWKIYYQCNTYSITTIIPLKDGTTYTLTMPAKYTGNLDFYWDEVAKYRDLDVLFDGSHRFVYGPNSLFVDSRNSLRTMTVTYNLTNGRWVSKPSRTLNYRFWCETLEGVAPDGKEALLNHSARQQLGTISDSRTYYLVDEGSIGDDPQLLTHGPYNEYKGFRVWLPYSDGNFLLYTNEWYIFFHAGTRYAGDIYGVTNKKGVNMYGYYAAGNSWESNAYYNDTDGFVDFYCLREKYNLIFHDGDETEPEKSSVLYEKNLAGYDPAVTSPDNYTPGVSRKTNPDGQEFVFEGWYTEKQLINKFDFASTTMPYMDVDLYAKWIPVTYTVTFKYENGESDEVVDDVAYGAVVAQPQDPKYTDHIFLGWTLNDRPYSFDSGISEDITLVAKWRSIEAYNVTYDLNGGSGTAPVDPNSYYEGSEVVVLDAEDLTPPEGKVFLGWKASSAQSSSKARSERRLLSASDDDTLYYANGLVPMPLGGLVLTAQWGDVDETVDLIYDYNFDSINYTAADQRSATISAIVNNGKVKAADYLALSSVVPKGYTFKEWNTKADGTGKTAVPGDEVYVDRQGENRLYAIWEKVPRPTPSFAIPKTGV